MDKITGLNHIAKILHDRSAGQADKTLKKSTTSNKKTSSDKPLQSIQHKLSIEDLELDIKSKIAKLNPDSNNFLDTANNIIIEKLLTWEFGDEIAIAPEFITLKNKISAAIKDNTPLNNDFDKLINRMINL